MEDLIQRVGKAKAFIDNGMCRVGPKLDKDRKGDALLSAASSRAISLADAVLQLCRHGHANEALPLLRHLAEAAVWMRWLASSGEADLADGRARRLAEELRTPQWEGLWSAPRLRQRLREAQMSDAEAEAEVLINACYDFVHGNAAVVPWNHVFSETQHAGARPEDVLRLTAFWMSHAVKALDARWPGQFPGAEQIWPPS